MLSTPPPRPLISLLLGSVLSETPPTFSVRLVFDCMAHPSLDSLSTDKPLSFVCLACEKAFPYPTAAMNDYLRSLSNHPSELSAHQRAARLR